MFEDTPALPAEAQSDQGGAWVWCCWRLRQAFGGGRGGDGESPPATPLRGEAQDPRLQPLQAGVGAAQVMAGLVKDPPGGRFLEGWKEIPNAGCQGK